MQNGSLWRCQICEDGIMHMTGAASIVRNVSTLLPVYTTIGVTLAGEGGAKFTVSLFLCKRVTQRAPCCVP
jgi:hypothetical protein